MLVEEAVGSLSSHVFETRTATGSELFSLLTYFHTTTFTLLSIFSPLEIISTKIWETPLSWHVKCSLPVAVRVSKTRVLKLLIVLTLKSAFRSCKSSVSFQPHSKGERIDVSVNENYDGSYYGKPEDMNDLLGYALSREGPCRRLSNTHVMVWR